VAMLRDVARLHFATLSPVSSSRYEQRHSETPF
jgi:hypothetical protein